MLINLVGDGHLGMCKGLKGLLVRLLHFSLDIVEQQGKGFTAKLRHLIQFSLQGGNLDIIEVTCHDISKPTPSQFIVRRKFGSDSIVEHELSS